MRGKVYLCIYLFLKILFLEGEGREKERERNISVMYKRNTDWLPLTRPQPGTWTTTQARALTGIEQVTFQFTGRCSIH